MLDHLLGSNVALLFLSLLLSLPNRPFPLRLSRNFKLHCLVGYSPGILCNTGFNGQSIHQPQQIAVLCIIMPYFPGEDRADHWPVHVDEDGCHVSDEGKDEQNEE